MRLILKLQYRLLLLLYGLFSVFGVLFTPTHTARSESIGIPLLHIDELVAKPLSFYGVRVAVTGSLLCLEQHFCFFPNPGKIPILVRLDVGQLTAVETRRIAEECHDKVCPVTVFGRFSRSQASHEWKVEVTSMEMSYL